jgi:hypothetical protein
LAESPTKVKLRDDDTWLSLCCDDSGHGYKATKVTNKPDPRAWLVRNRTEEGPRRDSVTIGNYCVCSRAIAATTPFLCFRGLRRDGTQGSKGWLTERRHNCLARERSGGLMVALHYLQSHTWMDRQDREIRVDALMRYLGRWEHFAWEFGGWSFPEVGFVSKS